MGKIKIGVMGLAETAAQRWSLVAAAQTWDRRSLKAAPSCLPGATTGVIHLVGKTAREAGAFHIGISPVRMNASTVETFRLPADACDAIIYTGFGLKAPQRRAGQDHAMS